MKPLLFAAISALAAWAGMATLCFLSVRQRQRMRLPEQTRRERNRSIAIASAMLALSYFGAIAADHLSFGSVLWICQVGILGLVMICLLPYVPVWVMRFSRVCTTLAPLLFLISAAI